MYHKLVENSNLQNIEKDLQRLFHVKTLHQQPLHHDHAVLEPKQDCDTGSHNWIMNCDHQYRDTSPCFVLVDVVLTPDLPLQVFKIHILYIAFMVRDFFPHSESVHTN
jgi:hypothetical protein